MEDLTGMANDGFEAAKGAVAAAAGWFASFKLDAKWKKVAVFVAVALAVVIVLNIIF